MTKIVIAAAVSCVAWNKAEDKLLLGCKDKGLVSCYAIGGFW
jgi:hypothetical protein